MAMLFRSDLQGLTVSQLQELSWKFQGDQFSLNLIAEAVEDRGFDPFA
jgi:hypothetical protein